MKDIFKLIVLLIGVLLIMGCTSSESDDVSKDYPITITNSIITPSILESREIEKASTGNVFLVLKVKIQNKGDKSIRLGSSGFDIHLGGQRYLSKTTIDTDVDPRFDGQDFDSQTILPKSFEEGWIIFEVPDTIRSATKAELRFTDHDFLERGEYSKISFNPSIAKDFFGHPARFEIEAISIINTYKVTNEYFVECKPNKDETFIVATLKIINNAKTEEYLSSNDFKLITTDETSYETSNGPTLADSFNKQDIPGGESVIGSFIFEVPKNKSEVKEFIIEVEENEVYSYEPSQKEVKIIENNLPEAMISSPDNGMIDIEMTFDGTNSTDPDNDSFTCWWDFGNRHKSYDCIDSYSYSNPGNYTVKLTITDIGGLTSVKTKEIVVIHVFSLSSAGQGIETNDSAYKGEYYVDVILMNEGVGTEHPNFSTFEIKTSDGTIYYMSGDNGYVPESIIAGSSASWRVYFDFPQNKTPIQVIYDDEVFYDLW